MLVIGHWRDGWMGELLPHDATNDDRKPEEGAF